MMKQRAVVAFFLLLSMTPAALAADTTPPSAPGLPKEGSATTDQDYDADGAYTVYWTAAADAQSGITAYQLQQRLSTTGTWTTLSSVLTGLNFAVTGRLHNTRYFYRVRAKNGAGLWGSWSSVSDGILVDTTAPATPATVTDDGAATSSTTSLHATWTAASDPESGIALYQYLIRQDSISGAIIVNWTSVGLATQVTRTGLTLTAGKTYYIGVRAKNNAGKFSAARYSNGIKVDNTAPPAPSAPIEGSSTADLDYDADGAYTVYWTAAADAESGITAYQLQERIGTTGTWATLSSAITVLNFQVTGRLHNTRYFYRVRAKNGAGLWGSWSSVSDGILVDTTAPATPATVTDDGAATSSTTSLHATWTAASDPESGVTAYQYQIRQSTSSGPLIRDWTSVGVATEVTATGLSLTAGASYVIGVRAQNAVGTFSVAAYSDGITVVSGGTTVGGEITTNTTWTLAGSPYTATSTVTVSNNATLTIEAGVQVQFDANTGLVIGSGTTGILNAQGTLSQPITLTSNSATPAPGQWNGIVLNTTTSASLLEYCTIEYGGADGNDANVLIYFSSPTIRHSTIRFSDGVGLLMISASPTIDHNTVISNVQGITIFPTGQEIIQHNTITNNTVGGLAVQGAAGVMARLNWWGHATGPSGIGPGSGSSITGNALFEPWLGQAPSDPFRWTDALNSPDPFTPSGNVTTFFGSLSQSANWVITIQGGATTVKTFSGTGTAFSTDWDGKNTSGATLPNGTYTYGLTATAGASVAAPARGSVTLNNTLPVANITSPVPDQLVPPSSINIMGTAAGANFSSYVLEYGFGASPDAWGFISSGDTPVTSGLLGTFDVGIFQGNQLPLLTFRLTVTSTTSETASEQSTIRVLFVDVFASLQYFSPNGDSSNETVSLTAVSTYPVNWTIRIKNGVGTVIRTFTGAGEDIVKVWDGQNDSGAPAPDGAYTVEIQGTHAATGVVATAPLISVTVDRIAPAAVITFPTQDQIFLTDEPMTFIGTASDANFQSFALDFGEGVDPPFFSGLVLSNTPVVNGSLHVFNQLQGLATGTYTFRLTVTDLAGASSVVIRQVVFDHVVVSDVSTNPFQADPLVGQQIGIHYTISRAATVQIQIRHPVSKQVMRTLTLPGQSAGAHTAQWDGKNGSGEVLPPEVYFFTLLATDSANPSRTGSFNNADTPLLQPQIAFVSDPTVDAVGFDPYQNDRTLIQYILSDPAEVLVQIVKSGTFELIRALDRRIVAAGNQTLLWDGRRDDGAIYQGRFNVFFATLRPLPLYPCILTHVLPAITNVRADAFLIQPIYGEVSQLSYSLTAPANVSITLTDPNGNQVRTLLSNVSQSAGAHTVEWNGKTDAGQVVSVEGDYKVTFTALLQTSVSPTTEFGTIAVYR